jgi:hypothetical protein
MLGIKSERMATNQIHCRSMSNNYIKSSREQYTAELHLEIRKIYIAKYPSSSEADLGLMARDEDFRARATTSKSSTTRVGV